MTDQIDSRLNHRIFAVAATMFAGLLPTASHAAEAGAPTPEGMLPHFESWIALAIVLYAVFAAWLLNHANPKTRSIGTAMGAFACFGIVLWFGAVLGTGVFENPKPYQVPMDAAKPALLWIQAGVALFAGIWLLMIAKRQHKYGKPLELSNANEVERYGRVSRMLHWTTAILFIFMIPTGIFASMIPVEAWYRTEYSVVHKTIGFIILGLLIARLVWNRRSKRPALDSSLKPREHKLAHGAHIMLYILMLAVPVTGYIMTSFHGYPSFFFMIKLEPLWAQSDVYIVWGLFHKYLLQYLVYLVLGAHVIGALKHYFIDKHESAFKRMVG
jgi:cytochrome b561